jgi:hypothetical protein
MVSKSMRITKKLKYQAKLWKLFIARKRKTQMELFSIYTRAIDPTHFYNDLAEKTIFRYNKGIICKSIAFSLNTRPITLKISSTLISNLKKLLKFLSSKNYMKIIFMI